MLSLEHTQTNLDLLMWVTTTLWALYCQLKPMAETESCFSKPNIHNVAADLVAQISKEKQHITLISFPCHPNLEYKEVFYMMPEYINLTAVDSSISSSNLTSEMSDN